MPETPQLVFEGNLPAVVEKNPLLNEALAAPAWPDDVRVATAWVGDAIAIKDPTDVVFRRQAGSHVLLIGQQDEGGARHPDHDAGQPRHPARRPRPERRVAQRRPVLRLRRLGARLAQPRHAHQAWPTSSRTRSRPPTTATSTPLIHEIGDELARRQADDQAEFPSIYLVIFDLGRFRDLRKSDDDFGFSSQVQRATRSPSPTKILTDILREGPNFGIHVIAWCDTVGNLNRTFERSTAGEFELRILFQMSINDSSALIDSPAAGRLGENRALYFNEEQGKSEKFRPYGLPDQAWLDRARDQLHAKPKPAGYNNDPPAPKPDVDDDDYGSDEPTRRAPPSRPHPRRSAPARSICRRSRGPRISSTTTRTTIRPSRTRRLGPGPLNLPPISRPSNLKYDDEPDRQEGRQRQRPRRDAGRRRPVGDARRPRGAVERPPSAADCRPADSRNVGWRRARARPTVHVVEHRPRPYIETSMTDPTPDKPGRRPRYRGKNPRQFAQKYKEHQPERYADDVAKVLAGGKTPAGSHRPIMVREILEVLAPKPGEVAVDGTLGYGGHARRAARGRPAGRATARRRCRPDRAAQDRGPPPGPRLPSRGRSSSAG